MPSHKSEDYKITTVKYYLEYEVTYAETCEIFKCSERSLKRWIERYKKEKSIKRYSRKPVSYKITKNRLIRYNNYICQREIVIKK